MTLLSEQLSAASSKYLTAPMNAQLNVFNALATQALDNASRITALNLSTSHDVIERSAQTARQLMGARDARDLAVLRSHAEEQVRSLFAYSRELFGIATSAQPFMLRTASPAALAAPALAEPAVKVAQVMVDASRDSYETAKAAAERTIEAVVTAPAVAPAPAAEPAFAAEPAPDPAPPVTLAPAPADSDDTVSATSPKDEPVVVQQVDGFDATPAPAPAIPDAPPKPIAKAAGNGAPQAATAATPLAAPIEERRDPDAVVTPTTPRRRKK